MLRRHLTFYVRVVIVGTGRLLRSHHGVPTNTITSTSKGLCNVKKIPKIQGNYGSRVGGWVQVSLEKNLKSSQNSPMLILIFWSTYTVCILFVKIYMLIKVVTYL